MIGGKMKKEFIICLIIIVLIIISNIVTQNYTKECVAQMHQKLEVLKQVSLSKNVDKSSISKEIENIENNWNEFQEKLAYYIEHDELVKVETQIWTIKGFEEIERYDEIIPELEKCVFILEHIQDKTKLNVKNIF